MKDVFAPNGGVFVNRLVEYVSGKGHDFSSLINNKITIPGQLSDSNQVLPVYEHSLVFGLAERVCNDASIGYSLAHQCTLRDAGLVGYAISASETLGEALQTLTQLSSIFDVVPTSVENGQVDLRWDYGSQGKLDLRHWSEFIAALLVRSLKTLSTGTATPVAVEFTHAPQAASEPAVLAFGLRPGYRGRVNRLTFREQDLAQPLRSADAGLLRLLLEHAELLRRRPDRNSNDLSITVERLIMDGMSDGEASLAQVADLLDMSQRTLSRKLAGEGTSFFAILEGVRKSLALRYLHQNEKSLSEISFALGYSSLSSFNDAFRRWYDQSPGSYRSEALRESVVRS
ncbi:AraC family transcriptional regulator [Tritonibacter mobilis]|uniref:AraC family transcriptional regulator n=1 Tax=Tritonibacter mobilis TaxID=379347 RepID=UPI000806C233|nr:AraC family transcriptional regulator [Tritonibacter mobilis]MEE2810812.1 AraC family transcriptional regulator ligand-binding domain-containing protein [Pseudomonadota bacterium]